MVGLEVLVLEALTTGWKVRLNRIAKGLRQLDVASLARLNTDITNIELDRPVHRWKLKRVLVALEPEDKQP